MGIFLNEESIFMESKQDDKAAISCAGKLYSHMVKYANHKEKQTKSWKQRKKLRLAYWWESLL